MKVLYATLVAGRTVQATPLSLALLVLLVFAPPVQAAVTVQVAACPTILQSLHVDWQSTQRLFARYGPAAEANPIVRAVGPDVYFAAWTVGVSASCKETRAWRWASVVVWAVQTYYVNTHVPWGTAAGAPLLQFTVKW